MPVYDPSKPDIEIPKEATAHMSFRVIQADSNILDSLDLLLEECLLNPNRVTFGNCIVKLKGLWRRVFTIMEEPTVRRVDNAFNEFALWYSRYSIHPSRRPAPYYSNRMIQKELNRRIEDIYRTINQDLQQKNFLYKIQERGKQPLKERMALIEAAIYGKTRNIPKVSKGPA